MIWGMAAKGGLSPSSCLVLSQSQRSGCDPGQSHRSPAAHCEPKSRDNPSLAAPMTNTGSKETPERRCQTRSPCQGLPRPPRAPPEHRSRAAAHRRLPGDSARSRGGPRGPALAARSPRRAPPLLGPGPGLSGEGRPGRPGVPGGSRGAAAAARAAPIDFPLWSFATKGRIQTLLRFVQSARRTPARRRLDPSPPSTPNRTPTLTTNQRPAARPISAGEPEHGLCVR